MKQVILMRTDLGMSVGKMCAQAVHASSNGFEAVIVLAVSSEEELNSYQSKAIKAGLKTRAVHDAGRTEVEPGTWTCISIGPADDKAVDKIIGSLKLL